VEKVKPAAFLLIKTNSSAFQVKSSIKDEKGLRWASATYGPYQVAAYMESEGYADLARRIESLRTREMISELDARMCKVIPGDEGLNPLEITKPESAILLVNVDYHEQKERDVACNLRKLKNVRMARAVWGPSDIIVVVEGDDHESMRNVICDEIKLIKGVLRNTTLYCYPEM